MIRKRALIFLCFFTAWPVSARQSVSPSADISQAEDATARHSRNPPAQDATPKETAPVGPNLLGSSLTPEMQNPRAAEFEATFLAALQRQKQMADAEVIIQRKLGIHPDAPQASVPSQTMAAHGTPLLSSNGAANRPATPRVAPPQSGSQPAGASASGPAKKTASGSINMAGGGTINPPVSGVANSKFAGAPQNSAGNSALACSTNPNMRILSVAGAPGPAIFTPIIVYDLYTVAGCSFGNLGPDAKAYIYKGGTFHEDFQIQEWHDNWIKLNLDPKISGVLDQEDVTLVIQRADGTQASKGGLKFHAVRAVVALQLIPSRWAHLVTWSQDDKLFSPEYSSPAIIAGKSAGPSAYVSRFANGKKFDPSAQPPDQQYDSYDLAGLADGWVAKSAQLQTFGTNCPLVVTYRQGFGAWRTQWDGTSLRVYLADETCTSLNPAFPVQHWDNLTGSYYRLTVMANGPRCTDPLTGKPDTQCIGRVQQGLP